MSNTIRMGLCLTFALAVVGGCAVAPGVVPSAVGSDQALVVGSRFAARRSDDMVLHYSRAQARRQDRFRRYGAISPWRCGRSDWVDARFILKLRRNWEFEVLEALPGGRLYRVRVVSGGGYRKHYYALRDDIELHGRPLAVR